MGKKYQFNDLFNVESFNKGLDAIESRLKKLDGLISGREQTKTGTGKALIQETKQIEELIKAEEELILLELDRKKLQESIQKANKETAKETKAALDTRKKAEKEANDFFKQNAAERAKAARTRAKAEKEAEKFLKQFNKEELKSNELLRIKKAELRDNAKAEIALERAQKKEVKTLKDLQQLNNALIRVRKNVNVTTAAGKKKYDELTVAIERNNRALLAQDKKIGFFGRNVGNYASGIKGLTASFGGLSGILGAAGITTGIAAVISVFSDFNKRGKELAKITRQIKQQFGVTNEEAKGFASTTKALADTFDQDYTKVLQAANAVSKELNISVGDALKNIEVGFKKGSNNTGEFLDILREYPAQFRSSNIDAKTFFAIINQQVTEGIYSDKGIDAIKEAGLSIRENTKATAAALAPLGKVVSKQIEQAKASGDTFKAIQLVSRALKDTSLTAQQTQLIIADVFKGAGEDAGLRYLQTLGDIEDNLEDVANQTSIVTDNQLELSKSYNGFVQNVTDGSGIISRAWAGIIEGASNILQQFSILNAGTAETGEVVKRNIGFYDKLNEIWATSEAALKGVTNLKKREAAAIAFSNELLAQNVRIQDKINKALADGISPYNKSLRNDQLKVDLNKELIKKAKEYITPVTEVTKVIKKEAEKVKDLTTEQKKQIANEKELIELQRMRDEFRVENAEILSSEDIQPIPLEQVSNSLDAWFEVQNAKLQEQRDDELLSEEGFLNSKKELEDEFTAKKFKGLLDSNSDYLEQQSKDNEEAAKQDAEFKEDIQERATNAIQTTANNIINADRQDRLRKIRFEADEKQRILDQQLAAGQISEAEFNKKKLALEKETATKQAKAEKKNALFSIGINTAVAIIKAAPNPFAIAAAAGLGLAQAAIVLAKGIPAFRDGGIDIEGPGTSTSDSIHARISRGESVIKASATKESKGILNLVNDEVLNDRNASEIFKKYNMSNARNLSLSQLEFNTAQSNKILRKMGHVLSKKDGSHVILRNDGTYETITLDNG